MPSDLGRSDVDALVLERGSQGNEESAAVIEQFQNEPLGVEGAMRLALAHNPQLRVTYAQLGFGAADLYAARRIRNPVFSAAILASGRSGERDQLSFGLVTSFTDLLTLSARKRLATAEYEALKQEVGAAVLATAADTQYAYYEFVACKQVSALREQTAKAAQLSLDLAMRYHDAGNLTPRDLAISNASAAEAKLHALEAAASAYEARTKLADMMGLSAGARWDAPAQLPMPLAQEDGIDVLLALAQRSRLDLAAAKARSTAIADRLGMTKWSRWLGELDLGIERERETDGTRLTGPTLSWEIPLFSQNRDALLRVDAELQISIAELTGLMTNIDNEVRLALASTQNAEARVDEYRERLIPARRAATHRAQEEENFMLIGVFELIETKQDEYDSYQGYLEAVRDYWLARTMLTRAVGNTLPSTETISEDRLDIETLIKPSMPGGNSGHSGHGAMNAEPTPDADRSTPTDHEAIGHDTVKPKPDTGNAHQHHGALEGGAP